MESLKDALDHVGIYAMAMRVVHSDDEDELADEGKDVRELMKDDGVGFAIMGLFTVGDVAWSRRTLHPEEYDEEKLFSSIVPTEADQVSDKYAARMEKLLESGDIASFFEEG